MNAVTFKPTGYRFKAPGDYFVQVLRAGGDQPMVGAFDQYSDAHLFASALQQRHSTQAVYIFTREQQVYDWHREALKVAA